MLYPFDLMCQKSCRSICVSWHCHASQWEQRADIVHIPVRVRVTEGGRISQLGPTCVIFFHCGAPSDSV